ncbi:VRR-NUC domain-containing protein [Aerococcus urinaeequi]|uniref:VRR-NUC domain-containing protein n=1 Tax=Aerococcus urinaeequi TaxID=51665 RepID=UPI00228275AC|nr:VRR-NUC domain-containing protein [Aerococcus urinaeequi]MCY7730786.1 VRR-NUC domain-containing protein [Aerococcus urinaeequi]
MEEAKIEKYLTTQVQRLGYMCLKFTSPGTRAVPDRIIIGKGQVHFVELKAPGQKPRADQLKMHDKLKAQGLVVKVIDSKRGVDDYVRKLIEGGLKIGS